MREFEPYAFTGTEYRNCKMDGSHFWMQKVSNKSITYISISDTSDTRVGYIDLIDNFD